MIARIRTGFNQGLTGFLGKHYPYGVRISSGAPAGVYGIIPKFLLVLQDTQERICLQARLLEIISE